VTATDSAFKELEAILRKESGEHEKLLAIVHAINDAARAGNVEAVRRETARLDMQAACAERLEAERTACCAALSAALSLPKESVKLSAIVARAPEERRSILASLGASLRATMAGIAAVNRANRILCEEGVRFAQGKLDIILRSTARYRGYRAGGCRYTAALPVHPFINRTV
jgi:hypothetical protein